MGKWEMVRLGDVADLITKGTTPTTLGYAFRQDGINFVKVECITENGAFLPDKFEHISEECNQKLKRSILKEGDILFSIAGALGRTAIVPNEILPANTNQALAIIRISKPDIDLDYVVTALQSENVFLQFQRQKQGVAQLNLSLKNIAELEIPLPPLPVQQQIADVLDRASALIEKRKAQIEKLDLLVKSQFSEMFGDPVTNPKGWEVQPLGELCSLITKGASPKWQGYSYSDDDSQTLFVTSENVREAYLDLNKPKYIENSFNDKHKRSILQKGDFLINIVGASIGRAAQYTLNKQANINQATALVRLKKDIINDSYLLIYLNSPKALQMYEMLQVSVARANLSLENISSLTILIPPMFLQNEFAAFVHQVEARKSLLQQSLAKLEQNYKSLMQKCFRGEVF